MGEEEHEAKWEGVREETWGEGAVGEPEWKELLWEAQQGLGSGAVRGNHIPDFPHQQSGSAQCQHRGRCLMGTSVGQISVAMGRCPTRMNVPPTPPPDVLSFLPSGLGAVPASCLEVAH